MFIERNRQDPALLDREISERLSQPHHAFVDEMQKNMRPGMFLEFLNTTQDRFGNLDASGTVPIYPDQILTATGEPLPHAFDAILQTQELIDDLKALGTTDENCQKVRETAYFAIWAHGTNPKENMRTRHTGEPYVLHTIRTAKRIVELEKINDADIISGALLHDILEDTQYQVDDLARLFGKRVTKYVEFASKLKSENLADLAKIETKLCWQYLQLHRDEPEARKALAYLERENYQYSPEAIGDIDKWYSTEQAGISLVHSLRSLLDSTEEEQLLTNMRLISLVNDPDDLGGLVIKIADVADNTATLDGLARAKPGKVAGKLHLAETVYLPMAMFIGLRTLGREIKDNIFRTRYPSRVEKFESIPRLSDVETLEIQEQFTELMKYFGYWVEDGSNIIKKPLPPDLFTLSSRFPTNAEIADGNIAHKRLNPFVEITFSDQLLGREFTRFLRESDVPSMHGVNPGRVTTVDSIGTLASPCKVYYGKGKSKKPTKVTARIYDDSGSPTDIFRAGASEVKKRLGRGKLSQLQRSFEERDLKSALALLALPMVSISIMKPSRSNQVASHLVPKGAPGWDALVLAGIYQYGGQIIRDGEPVSLSSVLKPGDVLVPAKYDATSGGLIPLDLVATDAARSKLSQYTKDKALNPRNDKEKLIRSEIIRRGKKVAAFLADTYEFRLAEKERRYRKATGWHVEEKFWQNLFYQHGDLLANYGNDEAFIALGLIPLLLTDDHDKFTASGYDKWSREEGVKTWLKSLHHLVTTQYIDILLPEPTSDQFPTDLATYLSPLSIVKETNFRDEVAYAVKPKYPKDTYIDNSGIQSVSMATYKIIDRIISLPQGRNRRFYLHLNMEKMKEIIAYLGENDSYWTTFGNEREKNPSSEERNKLITNTILDIAFAHQWKWVGRYDK